MTEGQLLGRRDLGVPREGGVLPSDALPGPNLEAGDLARLQRLRLRKLGRTSEAIASAWNDFERHPCRFAYEELMTFVPKRDRAEWREKALEKTSRAQAAKLWCAQAFRILVPAMSHSYRTALGNLARAKDCLEKAGRTREWDRVVREIRAAHSRKSSFMPGFERLVAGRLEERTPSFLERARLRWDERLTRGQADSSHEEDDEVTLDEEGEK